MTDQGTGIPTGLSVTGEPDHTWTLQYGGVSMRTPSGHPVAHTSPRLLHECLLECAPLVSHNPSVEGVRPERHGFYALLCLERDWVEQGEGTLHYDFARRLNADPILYDVPGPERIEQLRYYSPVHDCFPKELVDALRLWRLDPWGDAFAVASPDETLTRDGEPPVPPEAEVIENAFRALPLAARTGVVALNALHDGHVLAAIALVQGYVSVDEYASAVLASHCKLSGVFGGVSAAEEQLARLSIATDAQIVVDYLALASA